MGGVGLKFLLGASALFRADERLSRDEGLTRLHFSTEEGQTDLRGKNGKEFYCSLFLDDEHFQAAEEAKRR